MRALILGAAVSGRAAVALARALAWEPIVYDRRPEALVPLREAGFTVHNGAWSPRHLRGIDIVVTSPGFPPHSPPVVSALESGATLCSELEFAARYLDMPLVGVTGTNGKTTVTSLIADMLHRSGLRAPASGNIGRALSDVAASVVRGDDPPPDLCVVEASSFQLRFIDTFRADVAVLLNVAPDHLDWHGSLAAYEAAKAGVYRNQMPEDVLVYGCDDPGARRLAAAAPGSVVAVSGMERPGGGSGPEGSHLHMGDASVALDDLSVSDAAYLGDLAAAGTAALAAGASVDAVADGLRAFRPGPHRRRIVGRWDGITWVDDSKATNPHAAAASVAAYPSVVLIAGGRNKGLDLSGMVVADNIRHLVAIGEAAADLVGMKPAAGTAAASMEEAVSIARMRARPGDTVLLAPGCASFDMFDSYADRGDAFALSVLALQEVSI